MSALNVRVDKQVQQNSTTAGAGIGHNDIVQCIYIIRKSKYIVLL